MPLLQMAYPHTTPPKEPPKQKSLTALLLSLLTLPLPAQESLLWGVWYQQPLARWDALVGHNFLLGSDSLALRLTYSAFSEEPYRASFRNEAQGEVRSTLPLAASWMVRGRLSGDFFQDARIPSSERIRGRLLFGVGYRLPSAAVFTEIGWESLRQVAVYDQGWSGAVAASWAPERFPLSARFSAEGTRFRGWRQWYDVAAQVAWGGSSADTLLRGTYRLVSQDFPGIGVEFQRRREQVASGAVRITEPLAPTLSGQIALAATHINVWQGRVQPSPDSLPLRSIRLAGEVASSLHWTPPIGTFQLEFTLRYAEEAYRADIPGKLILSPELQQRRAQLALQEYSSFWSQLSARAALGLSPRDTLTLSTLLGILRYDTPSPQNSDDRDEQHGGALIQYRRSWRPGWSIQATLEFQRRHTVFLHALRSAWNHRLSVLALRWEAHWQGAHSSWNPRWEILASYTVRDYPYTSVLQDLALRQWAYRDSLTFRLTPGWKGELLLSGRVSRVGLFSWRQFAEQPQSTTQEFGAAFLLSHQHGERVWGIGVRASSFRYSDVRLGVLSHQVGIGPQVRVEVPTAYGSILASGWYELRRLGQSARWRVFPWFSLQLRKP